jgi:hypothetical protein
MNPHFVRQARQRGVALVTTVIVVAVLAVVAVAFMQSTTVDRFSSRSVANYTQAKLAAEAAAAAGQAMVADLIKRYPDSVTVWQDIGSGAPNGRNNEATVLYVRALTSATNLGASPALSGGAVTLLAQPLVSRVGSSPEVLETNLLTFSNLPSALPFAGDNSTTVNLNATNTARPQSFIGSRSSPPEGPPVTAAQWIYLSKLPGPTNSNNPVVARYAFWVEDESFKVNINTASNGLRGNASLGLSPSEMRLDGSFETAEGLRNAAGAVVNGRRALPGSNFPTALTAAIPAGLTNSDTAANFRFLTTVHSAGLDLSRGGFKRFNINSVTNGIGGPGDGANIRTGLDRILAAITNTNSMPNFGQRFYRATNGTTSTINSSNGVSAAQARIYLQKIAANLLDYVDADNQPTVVNMPTNNSSAFTIRTGRPKYGFDALGGGLDGTNSVAAMGVEALPRLQEYAIHARIRSMRHNPDNPDSFGFVQNTNVGANNPTSADFEIWLDHYFEFWNPSTNNIRLTNAFLKIYDQPAFGPSGKITGPLATAGRETSEIPIGTATFRPGRTVVLTTAREVSSRADASQNGFALIDTTKMASAADVVSLNVPDADRKFTGTTRAIKEHVYESRDVGPSVFPGNTEPYNRLFEVNLLPRSTSVTDYQSAVVVGNDNGVLESFVGLPIAASTAGTPAISLCVSNGYIRDGIGNLGAGNNDNVRGGSLRGNSSSTTTPSSTEGDPRALNEQLRFLNYVSGTNNTDQTRFYSTISSNSLPDGSTMGLPNANYVDPKRWFDVSSTEANATNAPLIVRNGPMQSIGELGHITDPARVAGPGGIELSRGGGRTLRVGQPEYRWWYDTNQNRPSRTWTSWRLADIFTTTAASNSATVTNAQGIPTNSLGVVRGATNTNAAVVTIPGLINPNGALRDNGAALRAALFGMSFQPLTGSGSLGVPGLAGLTANVNSVSTNLLRRLITTTGTDLPANALNPLWERGEISELALLNSGTALAPGVNMRDVFDRGREELVRRSIEMLTTRGSVFSVYAIGETLQGTNVTSTARLKQTFEIIPQFSTADAFNDNFNPTQATRVSRRFAPPTNYTVRVLATSYD